MKYVSGPEQEPVTLELAKSHLRVTSDIENTYILHLITASRQAAEQYIEQPIGAQQWLDDVGATVTKGISPVPSDLQAAMLLTIGHLYTNRESVVLGSFNAPYELPLGVKTLLTPYKVF